MMLLLMMVIMMLVTMMVMLPLVPVPGLSSGRRRREARRRGASSGPPLARSRFDVIVDRGRRSLIDSLIDLFAFYFCFDAGGDRSDDASRSRPRSWFDRARFRCRLITIGLRSVFVVFVCSVSSSLFCRRPPKSCTAGWLPQRTGGGPKDHRRRLGFPIGRIN